MINFIKKHWLFIVLAALASALAFLWLFKPTREPEILDLPRLDRFVLPGEAINTRTRITFNAKQNEQSTPVFSFVRKQSVSLPQASRIAEVLNFGGEPEIKDTTEGPLYIWADDNQFLTISANVHEVIFSSDLSVVPEGGSFISVESARGRLTALLEKMGLTLSNIIFKEGSRFLSTKSELPEEVSLNDANILEVTLAARVNEKIIVGSSPEKSLAKAWFALNGELVKLEWKNTIEGLTPKETYPLTKVNELGELIYQDAKIVQIGGGEFGIPVGNITNIAVSEIKLAYFLPEKGDILQPIFVLTGTAQATGGNYPIWIYVPAIKSAYFTQ